MLELYTREFWDWGLVQTDPNYGNFLIKPHPLTLVVLDFGATLRYDEEFRASYRDLLKDVSSRDPENIFDAFVKHGLLDPRESAESRRLLGEMMVISMEPFQPENQPFKFTDVDFAQRTRDITRAFSQSLKYSAPPKKILFLHRKLGGVFTFLKKLEIELDVSPYWDKLINRNG